MAAPGVFHRGVFFLRALTHDSKVQVGEVMSAPTSIAKKLLLERRRSVRFPCSLKVTCYPENKTDDACRAVVRNLSTSGVGIIADQCFTVGMVLTVRFQMERLAAEVTVLYVQSEGEAGWYHGCQFVRRLSESALDALLK
jgi:hypothetical protein